MEIRITIQTTEPLTGTAMTEGEDPLDFQGWLELLNTLSNLTVPGRHPAEGKTGASLDSTSTRKGAHVLHDEDSNLEPGGGQPPAGH